MSGDDQAYPTPSGRRRVQTASAARSRRTSAATDSTAPAVSAVEASSIHEEELRMNAFPSVDAEKLADAGFAPARAMVSEAAKNAARSLQAVTESFVTGITGLEEARAEIVASGVKALQTQANSLAAFSKVSSAQEALDLHAQLARQALEAQSATAQSLSALATVWGAALKPLRDHVSELTLPGLRL
jgi:hypothetical protein